MRTRLVLAVLALMGISFLAPAASAFGPVVLNAGCPDLGATTMADDRTAILLCTFPAPSPGATNCGSPSGCVWKPISGSGGSCYTDYALPPGSPVGSSCRISGFTIKGSLGSWGYCGSRDYIGSTTLHPPGGACIGGLWNGTDVGTWFSMNVTEAYLCCQN